MEANGSNMYILIDTSVLVSYLVDDDPNHHLGIEFMSSIKEDVIVILPPLCVFEISVTLSKLGYEVINIEDKIFGLINTFRMIICQLNDLQFVKNVDLLQNNNKVGTHDFYLLQTAFCFLLLLIV